MNTKKRRLSTDDAIRYNPRFRRPCTDDIGEFRGTCNFPPLSLVVASILAIVLVASCLAVRLIVRLTVG